MFHPIPAATTRFTAVRFERVPVILQYFSFFLFYFFHWNLIFRLSSIFIFFFSPFFLIDDRFRGGFKRLLEKTSDRSGLSTLKGIKEAMQSIENNERENNKKRKRLGKQNIFQLFCR